MLLLSGICLCVSGDFGHRVFFKYISNAAAQQAAKQREARKQQQRAARRQQEAAKGGGSAATAASSASSNERHGRRMATLDASGDHADNEPFSPLGGHHTQDDDDDDYAEQHSQSNNNNEDLLMQPVSPMPPMLDSSLSNSSTVSASQKSNSNNNSNSNTSQNNATASPSPALVTGADSLPTPASLLLAQDVFGISAPEFARLFLPPSAQCSADGATPGDVSIDQWRFLSLPCRIEDLHRQHQQQQRQQQQQSSDDASHADSGHAASSSASHRHNTRSHAELLTSFNVVLVLRDDVQVQHRHARHAQAFQAHCTQQQQQHERRTASEDDTVRTASSSSQSIPAPDDLTERVIQCYASIIQRLCLALWHEQLRCGFVSHEAGLILQAREQYVKHLTMQSNLAKSVAASNNATGVTSTMHSRPTGLGAGLASQSQGSRLNDSAEATAAAAAASQHGTGQPNKSATSSSSSSSVVLDFDELRRRIVQRSMLANHLVSVFDALLEQERHYYEPHCTAAHHHHTKHEFSGGGSSVASASANPTCTELLPHSVAINDWCHIDVSLAPMTVLQQTRQSIAQFISHTRTHSQSSPLRSELRSQPDSTSVLQIQPYHTLLLMLSHSALLASLPFDASPLLATVLRHVDPCKSFLQLSDTLHLSLALVLRVAAHLCHTGMAQCILPISLSHVYTVAANKHLGTIQTTDCDLASSANTQQHSHSHSPHQHRSPLVTPQLCDAFSRAFASQSLPATLARFSRHCSLHHHLQHYRVAITRQKQQRSNAHNSNTSRASQQSRHHSTQDDMIVLDGVKSTASTSDNSTAESDKLSLDAQRVLIRVLVWLMQRDLVRQLTTHLFYIGPKQQQQALLNSASALQLPLDTSSTKVDSAMCSAHDLELLRQLKPYLNGRYELNEILYLEQHLAGRSLTRNELLQFIHRNAQWIIAVTA